jgi:hypothetical protein
MNLVLPIADGPTISTQMVNMIGSSFMLLFGVGVINDKCVLLCVLSPLGYLCIVNTVNRQPLTCMVWTPCSNL